MLRCVATFDKMWEPFVRPLTPKRRLVVSHQSARSPLGTAAPTLQAHFRGARFDSAASDGVGLNTSAPSCFHHANTVLAIWPR
jgi:hypothetical protein